MVVTEENPKHFTLEGKPVQASKNSYVMDEGSWGISRVVVSSEKQADIHAFVADIFKGSSNDTQKEAVSSWQQYSQSEADEPKRSFPFLSTPSGNLKIEPHQVVFESKKVSVLVADPLNTKVNVKADLSELEKGDEVGGCMALVAAHFSLAQHGHPGDGGDAGSPTRDTSIESGSVAASADERRNSYTPEVIDWNKVNIPPKSELFKLLLYRISNSIKPDCKVLIAGDQFKCHSLVLQSYSLYFDDREPGEQFELPKDHVTTKAFATIYKWMIYPDPESHRLLTKENILEVFKAAQFLGIKELEEQCWTFIDCEELFSEESAFRMFLKARHFGMQAITELMVPRIMNFFLTLVSSRNFLHLDVDELCTILQSNYIAVHCEIEVFMSAVRWIMFDWENRESEVVEVMRCIRFGLIPPWQLVDIRRNPKNPEFIEITSNAEVQQMVESGLEYAIVKYWYGNNIDEFNRWCSKLGLDAPCPRNWIGDDKNYATYQEFLQDLELYRRNALEGRSAETGHPPAARTPRQEAASAPASRLDGANQAKDYTMPRPQGGGAGRPQDRGDAREPVSTDTSTSTGEARAMRQSTTADSESPGDSAPAPPPPPGVEGLCLQMDRPPLHVPRRAAPLEELTRRLSASLLGPVTRDYLVEGSLFLAQSESVLVLGGADPTWKPAPEGAPAVGRELLRLRLDAGCWEHIAQLPEPRQHHAAAFLKGHVYIAGIQKSAYSGDAKAMYDGIKKAIGPTVRKTAPLKSKTGEVITDEGKQMERWVEHYLELYAAENEGSRDECDTIKPMPVMEELDAMPTMEELSREIDSLANGKAPGGKDPRDSAARSRGGITSTVWSLEPASRTWSAEPDMLTARQSFALVACSGRLYAIGGQDRSGRVLRSVERFNPVSGVWEYVAPMREARMGLAAAQFRGLLWVAGGMNGERSHTITDTVECYDPRSNAWTMSAQLRQPVCFSRLLCLQDTLFLAGGATRATRDAPIGSIDSVDVWDPTQGRWCVRAKLSVPRHGHAVGYIGTHLLVVGGLTTVYVRALSSVEAFCCEAGARVRSVPDLPAAVAGHDIVTLPPAALM
ncbi:uncharacterized protein LOC126450820 [Schistocerca serialis cubense]|uniref:uncharacterized protein LOC126450820 n=1 Tax=Schistocerca serialis cubense TaxID=2023355 RepID=UPI00214E8BF4|nr:uncharacterized protein LOC126450820 [Schistocerca serialis cubense]